MALMGEHLRSRYNSTAIENYNVSMYPLHQRLQFEYHLAKHPSLYNDGDGRSKKVKVARNSSCLFVFNYNCFGLGFISLFKDGCNYMCP